MIYTINTAFGRTHIGRENGSTRRKPVPLHYKFDMIDIWLNPGRLDEKPETKGQSYGMTMSNKQLIH
jgi:hypothetical protein